MLSGVTVVTDPKTLAAHCRRWRKAEYITVDTEFMREKTYWPQLCLVQVGGPDEALVIDPLADDMDLAPFFALLTDPGVVKVFHAARQDIEVFYHLSGGIPAPLFDTQVAAMVCGFGESVGYERLAAKIAGATIDKTLRFTDWSRRPLTERQLLYALSDVSHLRPIYETLARQLEKSGRWSWLDEEMAILSNPATYENPPENAWRRIKVRGGNPRFLAILREISAWREREAQRRNVPRNRVLRDEALTEIAAHAPKSMEELTKLRSLTRLKPDAGAGLLAAVQDGLKLPEDQCPRPAPRKETPAGIKPLVDLLKVLLKTKAERSGVAQKLIANSEDLERIAAGEDDVPALRGWRREVFGEQALALREGRIALTAARGRVRVVPHDQGKQKTTSSRPRQRRSRGRRARPQSAD